MEGPSSALSQAYISAPSRRTLPPTEGHKPTSTRANVVLPEADGPTTASTSPGFSANATALRMASWVPGAATVTLSTFTMPLGCGSGIASAGGGTVDSNLFRRRKHAPAQDRRHDHHAAAATQVVVQQQPGAQSEEQ